MTFGAAADAVSAAVAAQQAAHAHGEQHPDRSFMIRVGVSVGDVVWRGDDVHGSAVVEAARLCDQARGGQILTADLVRALARGRGGHDFEAIGSLELKGLPDPLSACEVRWTPRRASDAETSAVPFAGDLVRLLPDLPDRVQGLPAAVTSDARAEEHRLLEAVAAWLVATSRERGLVLVVDDLHWATRPTLQMLLHVLRAIASDPDARVWMLGTYRDTDVDRAHPLQATLADLRRLDNVRRRPIEPFTVDEVIEFGEWAAGHELDGNARDLIARAHRETDGNPFFVGEVLRHFVETGIVRLVDGRWEVAEATTVDVPEGVRDVIGRRLDRLSGSTNRILTTAAVIGRSFELDVLADLLDESEDDLLDVLDEALRARLVEELSATRRRRLHDRITDTLERLRPGASAQLAHHALLAGPVSGDVSRPVRHCLAAGEEALVRRAHGDAEQRFRQAVELLEDADTLVRDRLQARCGLGEAQRHQGPGAGDPGDLHPRQRRRGRRRVRTGRRAGRPDRRPVAARAGQDGPPGRPPRVRSCPRGRRGDARGAGPRPGPRHALRRVAVSRRAGPAGGLRGGTSRGSWPRTSRLRARPGDRAGGRRQLVGWPVGVRPVVPGRLGRPGPHDRGARGPVPVDRRRLARGRRVPPRRARASRRRPRPRGAHGGAGSRRRAGPLTGARIHRARAEGQLHRVLVAWYRVLFAEALARHGQPDDLVEAHEQVARAIDDAMGLPARAQLLRDRLAAGEFGSPPA